MIQNKKLNYLIKTSLLAVIAFVIQLIEFPLFFFPEFLKIDLSDIPAIIAGFSLGPIYGVAVELLKNSLHLMKTTTSGVGELANFLIGAAFVLPASIIYRREKTKRSAIIGMLVGIASMAIVGAFANLYILIPFYAEVMKFPVEAIVGIAASANKLIVDLNTYILYAVVPFNIIKGILVTIITLLVYKRISKVLH